MPFIYMIYQKMYCSNIRTLKANNFNSIKDTNMNIINWTAYFWIIIYHRGHLWKVIQTLFHNIKRYKLLALIIFAIDNVFKMVNFFETSAFSKKNVFTFFYLPFQSCPLLAFIRTNKVWCSMRNITQLKENKPAAVF